MHDPIVIGCAIFGFVIAVIQLVVANLVWKQSPDLLQFIEIGISTLLLYGAIRVGMIAWSLPETTASDEEKVYLFIAAVVMCWLFLAGVIRKFKPPKSR